jgi:hypothetical protein
MAWLGFAQKKIQRRKPKPGRSFVRLTQVVCP